MYNRYVRNDRGDYARVPQQEMPEYPPVSPSPPPPPHPPGNSVPPSEAVPERKLLSRLLDKLHLGDVDSGDLLLLLILFFLFRQEADEEVLIAIGLLLIL